MQSCHRLIKIRLHSQNTDIKPKKEQNYVCGCRPIPIHALPKMKWGFSQSVLTDYYRTHHKITSGTHSHWVVPRYCFRIRTARSIKERSISVLIGQWQNSDSEKYKRRGYAIGTLRFFRKKHIGGILQSRF